MHGRAVKMGTCRWLGMGIDVCVSWMVGLVLGMRGEGGGDVLAIFSSPPYRMLGATGREAWQQQVRCFCHLDIGMMRNKYLLFFVA